MKATDRPWICDYDGTVLMEDQARFLLDDIGTERAWVAIGTADDDGIAEVVALAHPSNAALIVQAVNSHEALIETMQSILDWAETTLTHADYAVWEHGFKVIAGKARAALKLAGGE